MLGSFQRVVVVGGVLVLLAGVTSTGSATAEDSAGVAWTSQFGTSQRDEVRGVAVDSSGAYVAGSTNGVLPGQATAGGDDAYVRKYDTTGNVVWTRQFGTAGQDLTRGVAANASGVYVTGVTHLGSFEGYDNAGWDDVFLRKYDADGNHQWTRQFGTSNSEWGSGVAVAGSAVYVTGVTNGSLPGHSNAGEMDGFVRKYDTAGNELWTRQFGTNTQESVAAIAVDTSGVYVVGDTGLPFPGETIVGGWDGFARKYDAAGNHQWTRQFGTSEHDAASGVAVNATGVYVTGATPGSFPGYANAGHEDGFLRKYNAAGNEVWTKQFGTSGVDYPHGVAVDASRVYVSGWTDGVMPGQTSAGDGDAFVRRYDPAGNEVWTDQFGTDESAGALDVEVDAFGVYVGGWTHGAFYGQVNAGGRDGFVRRYREGVATCMGWAVTIAGTDAGDTVNGTPGNDVIDAKGGNDTIFGRGGDDVICGGPGNDLLVDGKGSNVFSGGDGDDEVRAGGVASEMYGDAGNDTLRTWAAAGHVDGGTGDDDLRGSDHDETFRGGPGHDTIRAYGGSNIVFGGDGNDTVYSYGGIGDQVIDGGAGNDTLYANQGNDTLIGGEGDDAIYGRKGDDTIDGGAGHDRLWGQQGNDVVRGGGGNDMLAGWGGRDELFGDAGDDTIYGGDDNDVAEGGDGIDQLVGGLGDDRLDGGAHDDTLDGRDGDDILRGGSGGDFVKGGPGHDSLWGDTGNDDLRGARGNDTLWGGGGDDDLRGHAGADSLSGQNGHDLLWGGLGDDQLDGGEGIDDLDGGADVDECSNGEAYVRCEGIIADPEPEVVQIEDGFESYAVGTYPSAGGWYVEWSGREAYVTDEYPHTGANSFRLSGNGGWVRTDALQLDLSRAKRLSYEVAVYCSSEDVNCAEVGFFVRTKANESWPFNTFQFREDRVVVAKGTGWRIGGPSTGVDTGLRWTHDRWYQLRAEIDYEAETISFWIDGDLVAEDLIAAPRTATSIFELSTHYGFEDAVVFFDDVRIEIANTSS